MKACAEFYCRQIAEKFCLKITAMHNKPRRVDTDQFVVFLILLRVFVQPADSTPASLI